MAEDKLVHDLEAKEAKLQPKTIYAGDQFVGQPYVVVDEKSASMVGGKTQVISVDPEFGILLGGKVSISCMPAEVSFGGGYWRLDPRHLSTVPSTTPTPIPLLKKAKPQLLQPKKDLENALDGMASRGGKGIITDLWGSTN